MKLLCVIDMQNDFIDGVLGSPEAQATVPKVVEKIRNADLVVLTRDTHYDDYLETEEGKHLPILHCLFKTKGWQLNENILNEIYKEMRECGNKFILPVTKETFGYNWKFLNLGNLYDITEIEIVGLDTDFCVLANAMTLKAAFPNVPITIDASCCAGSTPEWHEKALDMLEHCHFNVINR